MLGTFTWQMQPYCNKVTVTLTVVTAGYMLHGFDDQCGTGTRGSAAGTAVLNPDGTASVNFTIVMSGTARVVQVSGIVSPASGQGTRQHWPHRQLRAGRRRARAAAAGCGGECAPGD